MSELLPIRTRGYEVQAPSDGWDGRRIAVFRISATFLEKLFVEGPRQCFQVEEGIPPDGRVVAVQFDYLGQAWEVAVESERFEPTVSGAPLPNACPIVVTSYEVP